MDSKEKFILWPVCLLKRTEWITNGEAMLPGDHAECPCVLWIVGVAAYRFVAVISTGISGDLSASRALNGTVA
jgi:hypothetical protein